ncbi:head-tail connector protein [Companilactobacillus muriivasis]|uniref:head-tail connector protein n=1 Tax=Companilactobacillus muriivasis TaxID=3081444 RepID=UPI0030C678B1
MVTLQDIKNSLRVTHELDDVLLQNYIDTAQDYIMSAVNHNVSIEDFNKYKQFDFATSLLAQYWYNTRNTDVNKQVPVEVTAMIQQLRGRLNETTGE